jgi:hypothetical protein
MQKRAEKRADIPRLQTREPEVIPLVQRHSTTLSIVRRAWTNRVWLYEVDASL